MSSVVAPAASLVESLVGALLPAVDDAAAAARSLLRTLGDAAVATGPLLGQQGDGLPFGVLLALGVLAAGGYGTYHTVRRRRKRDDLERLIARDPRLRRTVIPAGLRPDQLAWWCRGLPAGDRRQGLEYGVEGPMVSGLDDPLPAEVDVAAFRWWWEERQRSRNRRTGMTSTRYSKRTLPAAVIKLPFHVDRRVLIRPESVLGRVGITRGGRQLESSEFNRRFRVEAMDERLPLHLLDANLQQLLVERFQGRTIEIFGELLLVAGSPDHRDETLTGVVGELPAMREDALRILREIPPAFWRTVLGRQAG